MSVFVSVSLPGPVLLRKLLRDLWSRKGSLLVVTAIVTIGVGSYVGLASIYLDMAGARDRYYADRRLADFTVDLKRAPAWAIDRLNELPNIRAVRGRVNVAVRIDLPGQDVPILGAAISMPPTRVPVLNDIHLRSGTWFTGTGDEEVILDASFAREHDLRPGSRLRVLLPDRQHDLLIVGTALSPEHVYLMSPGGGMAPDPARFGVMYLPEDFLQEVADSDGAYNQVIGLAQRRDRVSLENTLKLLTDRLDAYGVTNTTPVQDQPSVQFLDSEIAGLKVSATVGPAIFLGVAALILNVLAARIVAQQRGIIGTLKGLGYTDAAIMRHYLGFGVMLGLTTAATGLAFGRWIQVSMAGLYRQFFALPEIPTHVYPAILFTGAAISLVCSCAGTLKSVWQATRLAPAVAMRPPPPEVGGKILPERAGFLWRRLSFRWKLILRSVFRNPFRSTVTVVASLVSTALIVMTLTMQDMLQQMMRHEFEEVAHQDITISLRDPVDERAVHEVAALPQVSLAEPQLAVACELRHGPYRKRVSLTGLPAVHRLYTPLDADGRPVAIPEEGLVLSSKLAEVLHVRPGDRLHLRPLIGSRRQVTAVVVSTVESYLGLPAYASIPYLSRLLDEAWTANVILVTTHGGRSHAPLLEELKRRPGVIGIGERRRAFMLLEETFGETMGVMLFIQVLFAGVIAFGSTVNAALVSLSEREREVGTLRVLGYGPGYVAGIFAGESFLLSAVSIALGVPAGIGLVHLIAGLYETEMFRFPVIIQGDRLVMAAVLILLFTAAAQLIIRRQIGRMDWLAALKLHE